MATEIERKFLVHGDAWRQIRGVHISQGYLNRDKERTVRVRVAGGKAFLSIKGATTGATRAEFECEIPSLMVKNSLSSACGHHREDSSHHPGRRGCLGSG